MKRIAYAVSGSCTIADYCLSNGVPAALLIADRDESRGCRGMEIARKHKIPFLMLSRSFKKDFDRPEYARWLALELREHRIDLMAMMGFMTILDPVIFDEFGENKILNIHPSFFKNGRAIFPGDHAVRDAFNAGHEEVGTTVHWATKELDAGPVVKMGSARRWSEDTIESLHERLKQVERPLYASVLCEQLAMAV
jgi:phosphoribosylglycinamide formyltransferase-1